MGEKCKSTRFIEPLSRLERSRTMSSSEQPAAIAASEDPMDDRDLRSLLHEIIADLDAGRIAVPRPRTLAQVIGAPVLATALGLGLAACSSGSSPPPRDQSGPVQRAEPRDRAAPPPALDAAAPRAMDPAPTPEYAAPDPGPVNEYGVPSMRPLRPEMAPPVAPAYGVPPMRAEPMPPPGRPMDMDPGPAAEYRAPPAD
jgi:hypothetical protein